MTRALAYDDFYRTGIQDCGNVMTLDEFDLDGGTAEQIVDQAFSGWEEDGMEEQWLDQQDDFEGLDPHKCFEHWKRGWKTCAVREIEHQLERRDRDGHENPADHPFYVDGGDGTLVPEHASFEEALDDAVTRVVRGGVGPVKVVTGSEVDGFDELAEVMEFDQYPGRHAIGELHEEHASPEVAVILTPLGANMDFGQGAPYTADVEYGPKRGGGMRDLSTIAVILESDEQRTNPGAHRSGLTARRAKDFRDNHNYEVVDATGTVIALMFRDPESRDWYEDQMPGEPQVHYVERWRGFTKDEALDNIAKRRGHGNPAQRAPATLTPDEVAKLERIIEGGALGQFELHEGGGVLRADIIPGASLPSIAAAIIGLGLEIKPIKGDEFGRVSIHRTAKKRGPRAAVLRPPPEGWMRRPVPSPRPCYQTKADALKAFLDVNSDIVENYGGADYEQSPSEFDSINHKYGLKGKRAARSIADAVWYAMPMGKPYCLERIDLDVLNGISAVVNGGIEFRLPDVSYEALAMSQEAAHYARMEQQEEDELPSWVTEHTPLEPERVFPALPSMEGVAYVRPYRMKLEEREPGVETYSLFTSEDDEPMTPPPVYRPPPPYRAPEGKPVKLTLEDQEPGVATFQMNPPAEIHPSEIYGKKVRVHYNLHRCPRGRDPGLDEACWVVSTKQGGTWKVAGYVPSLLIADAEFQVSKPGVGRIREQQARSVVAWIVGTAKDPGSASARDTGWAGVGFNPFKADHFYLYESGKEIEHAALVYVSGRKAMAKTGRGNPSCGCGNKRQLDALADDIGGEIEVGGPEENPAGDKVKIKMTSTRTGKVGWIRPDGTPSDYESEAGAFSPEAAQDVIDEYTANLVRVVGRNANRFEMLPTSNPPPGEHHRRVAASKGRRPVSKDAFYLLDDEEVILDRFDTLNDALTALAQLKSDGRISLGSDEGRGDIIAWSGPPHADSTDGELTIVDARDIRRMFSLAMIRRFNELRSAPKENPAWVTKIIAKHYEELEGIIPLKWLPRLTKAKAQGGRFTATMKEYGCGAYGCVLPTHDEKVVLKLTTDDTEAEFAADLAGKLAAPIVVKYHRTEELPDKYKGRQSFLLWRDAADHVGDIDRVVNERGGDGRAVDKAIAAQHKAAGKAFDVLDSKGWNNKKAQKLIAEWEVAARAMGETAPELKPLALGMIRVLRENKVFMGDVHRGNIGRVNNRWVVIDPGHIAVLNSEEA